MPPHPDPYDPPAVREATARKIAGLLAGDFLLYELTAEREMRVLHLPRRRDAAVSPAAASGRASRRAGGGATPAP